jgi:hypothetical protein
VSKLILLAMVLFTSVVPLFFTPSKNPQRALRQLQVWTVLVTFLWAYACRSIYPDLVHVE